MYELLDADAPGSPQGDAGYGLFDDLGNPKPVAVDIHNMNIILADPDANATTFTPISLAYAVGGESATGNDRHGIRPVGNGSYVVALWDEQSIWNVGTGAEVAPVDRHEVVSLWKRAGILTQYVPRNTIRPRASRRSPERPMSRRST